MLLKTFLIFSAFFSSQFTFAQTGVPLRVMSFNTMCRSCDVGLHNGTFEQRLEFMADTIKRNDPDLISLQEFESPVDVQDLEYLLDGRYQSFYKQISLWPATDEVLMVRRDRFEILDTWSGWVGPNFPKFSWGWKTRIPRRFTTVKVRDLITKKEIVLMGSHFDSTTLNRDPSAELANKLFSQEAGNIIFAGDTNIYTQDASYKTLIGDKMVDTYTVAENIISNLGSATLGQSACSDGVSRPWPDCRIDHILTSKNLGWKIKNWIVDLKTYYRGKTVSDHRAVMVELY